MNEIKRANLGNNLSQTMARHWFSDQMVFVVFKLLTRFTKPSHSRPGWMPRISVHIARGADGREISGDK